MGFTGRYESKPVFRTRWRFLARQYLLGVVVAALLIVSSAFGGELGALCSGAKDFVSAAKVQEGTVITYPTPGELAASTIAYAGAKKRYFAELRCALPILIAIGLKERPETSEVQEFRSPSGC